MRRFFWLVAAALATCLGIPAAGAAPSGDDENFQFRKGSRWAYVGTANGMKTRLTQEVYRVSQGDLFTKGEPATVYHLLVKTVKDDGNGQNVETITTTSYMGVSDGYFITGSLGGMPVRLYKLGSGKGETWPYVDPRIKPDAPHSFTHLGVEQITVPAGTFKNARHLQVVVETPAGRNVGDFYVVPGIGVVKTQASAEQGGMTKSVVLELESFSASVEF